MSSSDDEDEEVANRWTWGDLGAEVRAATAELKRAVAHTDALCGDTPEQIARRAELIELAASCLAAPDLAARPARLVVEVQFMADEYYAMRKRTHAWYKTDRAANALGLMYDYIGGLGDD